MPAARMLLSINFYQDNGANDLSARSHKLRTTSVFEKQMRIAGRACK